MLKKLLFIHTVPTRIQDYCRQHQHQCSRSYHHRLFPKIHCSWLPVFLRCSMIRPPAWHLNINMQWSQHCVHGKVTTAEPSCNSINQSFISIFIWIAGRVAVYSGDLVQPSRQIRHSDPDLSFIYHSGRRYWGGLYKYLFFHDWNSLDTSFKLIPQPPVDKLHRDISSGICIQSSGLL